MTPPLIYNLFPRLVGPTTRWPEHAARAAAMGFDWLYLNPWQYPGFSGSLYAIKDLPPAEPALRAPGRRPGFAAAAGRALGRASASTACRR